MNTTNHTLGTWQINICKENGPFLDSYFIQADAKHWDGNDIQKIICRFPTGTGQFGEMGRENLANANLICAAPDMFAALQSIIDAFGDKDSLIMEQCKAAIAKAKGRAEKKENQG